MLDAYIPIVGQETIEQLRELAEPLAGMKVIHVNSTRIGGGVAEILANLVPMMEELGLKASWEVIHGNGDFFECTKRMHNALQGQPSNINEHYLQAYERTNVENAEHLRPILEDADIVFIHDPQPAPLLHLCPKRKGKWIWRCHIDVSHPYRPIWRYLTRHIADYDASVFSLRTFAQSLPHPQYLIAPSIDPLSEKKHCYTYG